MVSEADLIVVGTLSPAKDSFEEGDEYSLVETKLSVKETLYGKGPEEVPLSWYKAAEGTRVPISYVGPQYFEEQAGKARIWCLTREKDGWRVAHACEVIPVEQRQEVERLIQVRLAQASRDAELLKAAGQFSISDSKGRLSLEEEACRRLGHGGALAVPAVRELLKHPKLVQRAWGCRLAGRLKDPVLAGDLVGLLEDAGVFVYGPESCTPCSCTVGVQARDALSSIAGQNLQTVEEAKAWVAAHAGKPTPP